MVKISSKVKNNAIKKNPKNTKLIWGEKSQEYNT